VLEWRNRDTITPPAGTLSTETWSALILDLPSPAVTAVLWTWRSSAAPPGNTTPGTVIPNSLYDFNGWDNDVSSWRGMYRSQTAIFDAPSLADQGKVYSAQQRLNGSLVSTPVPIPDFTVRFNGIPSFPDEILQLSAKSDARRAREGDFSVLKCSDPMFSFLSGVRFTNVNLAFAGQPPSVVIPLPRAIMGLADFTASWTLFTGMSSTATIELKTIHGYEIQPAVASAWGPFSNPSARLDTKAMESAIKISHGLQDTYPAAMNSFGSMFSALGNLAPAALGAVVRNKKLLKKVTGLIPGVGQTVSGLIDFLPEDVEEQARGAVARVKNTAAAAKQHVQSRNARKAQKAKQKK